MSNFLSLFWQRLLHDLGLKREPEQVYQLDDTLLQSVQYLAERERRSEEEIASDLLSFALEQRGVDEANMAIWDSLTPREKQVTALTCLNFTNYEIAYRLKISTETVKTHVRNVLRKFELHSKAELQMALVNWDFSAWLDL